MQKRLILPLVLVAVTLALFLQTASHDFINFDDPGYVTANPVVKGGLSVANIAWAFTATVMSNWHPLTWLSHMLDVQLFGLNPAGHHLMSVFVHATAAVILFQLLAEVTGAVWQSFFVALLFSIHPLHVESVAWVAERKDVLSAALGFLALLCYARYGKNRGTRWYFFALLAFALGLMAKPMLVTIPLVMLLLDWWPLSRYGSVDGRELVLDGKVRTLPRLVTEKIPFFVLSGLSCVITIYGQHHGGAMATLDRVPLWSRVENALVAYVKYLGLMFWPHDLGILYPFPKVLSHLQAIAAFFCLVTISFLVVRYRRRFPYLVTGWLWHIITLLPVIGLLQVGGQSMADRYTYIPLIGPFIICCWLTPELLQRWPHRKAVLGVIAGVALGSLGAATWHQIGYWKNDLTLYRHTLAVTTDNYLILNNYGTALDARGDHAGAYTYFQEALKANPASAMAHNNLGSLLLVWGQPEDAARHFQKALTLSANNLLATQGLGRALVALGRYEEAARQFETALSVDPSLLLAHENLALIAYRAGNGELAQIHYQAALNAEPGSPKVAIDIGIALSKDGMTEPALYFFNDAVRISPESVEAHFNKGVLLAQLKRREEAAAEFSRVLQLDPATEAARHWLARLR